MCNDWALDSCLHQRLRCQYFVFKQDRICEWSHSVSLSTCLKLSTTRCPEAWPSWAESIKTVWWFIFALPETSSFPFFTGRISSSCCSYFTLTEDCSYYLINSCLADECDQYTAVSPALRRHLSTSRLGSGVAGYFEDTRICTYGNYKSYSCWDH